MDRTILTAAALIATTLLGTAAIIAGPLSPPSGTPASTYRTLQEVEPRIPISAVPTTISTPGSYYLTGNFSLVSGVAIIVSAPNVTIDLRGHTLSGGNITISLGATATSATIANGNFAQSATAIAAAAGATDTVVRNVTITGNTAAAMILADRAVVDNIKIAGQAATFNAGITVGPASRVTNCSISGVRERALVLGLDSTASNILISDVNNGSAVSMAARTQLTDAQINNVNGDAVTTDIQTGPSALGGVVISRVNVSNVALNGFTIQATGSLVADSSVSRTGSNSFFGTGVISSGILATATNSRFERNRFIRCGYPIAFASGSSGNSAYANSAASCNNPYTDLNLSPQNSIGPIINATLLPTGPWDNTLR